MYRSFYAVLQWAAVALILQGCAQTPVAADSVQQELALPVAVARGINTRVWDCQGTSVVARLGPGEMALFLPQRYLLLSQTEFIGHKGAERDVYREQAVSVHFIDSAVGIASAGQRVDIEVDGLQYRDCNNDRRAAIWEHAKLSGVSFRATGNEPGWVLELGRNNRLQFTANYGQDIYTAAMVEPLQDTDTRHSRYQFTLSAEALPLQVDLWGQPCSDSMSGESFETRVEVKLGDKLFSGCGRALH